MKVEWTRLAEESAVAAAAFIGRDKPGAAGNWLDRVHSAAGELRGFPNRGRIVPELGKPDYREIVVRPYRIVYRVFPQRVVIVAVRHSRQAWSVAHSKDQTPP